RAVLRHPAGAVLLQPGAVDLAARRQLLLVPVPHHRVRAGPVHAQRAGLRIPVAQVAVAGRPHGADLDLPGAAGHAPVRAHLPGTAAARPTAQRGHGGADRLLPRVRRRLGVAALPDLDPDRLARGAAGRAVDRADHHPRPAPWLHAGAAAVAGLVDVP